MRDYERIAVDALYDYVSANLAAYTPSGLDAPEYVRASAPADNRSPLIQVYDVSTAPHPDEGHRNHLAVVECELVLTFNGDADFETDEVTVKQYVTAIRQTLMSDVTLAGAVVESRWTDIARDFPVDYDSQTRHVRAFGIEVLVHDAT